MDIEEAYSEALCASFSGKPGAPFEVVRFTGIDSIREFTESTVIDLLLCGSDCLSPELEQLHIDRFVLLSDELQRNVSGEYPVLYRYQPVGKLWEEVLLQYEMLSRESAGRARSYRTEVYTVYSPVSRCGKTNFSLALAKVLGEKCRALYLNFEDYACFSQFGSEEDMDLSDALFFLEQDSLAARLPQIIRSVQGFHMILPVHCPADIRGLTAEQMQNLLDLVEKSGHYDLVVIDAGCGLQCELPLLRRSHRIYVPVREDPFSIARVESMERYYASLGETEILEKCRRITVPFCGKTPENGRHNPERLFWGELPDFVRSIL